MSDQKVSQEELKVNATEAKAKQEMKEVNVDANLCTRFLRFGYKLEERDPRSGLLAAYDNILVAIDSGKLEQAVFSLIQNFLPNFQKKLKEDSAFAKEVAALGLEVLSQPMVSMRILNFIVQERSKEQPDEMLISVFDTMRGYASKRKAGRELAQAFSQVSSGSCERTLFTRSGSNPSRHSDELKDEAAALKAWHENSELPQGNSLPDRIATLLHHVSNSAKRKAKMLNPNNSLFDGKAYDFSAIPVEQQNEIGFNAVKETILLGIKNKRFDIYEAMLGAKAEGVQPDWLRRLFNELNETLQVEPETVTKIYTEVFEVIGDEAREAVVKAAAAKLLREEANAKQEAVKSVEQKLKEAKDAVDQYSKFYNLVIAAVPNSTTNNSFFIAAAYFISTHPEQKLMEKMPCLRGLKADSPVAAITYALYRATQSYATDPNKLVTFTAGDQKALQATQEELKKGGDIQMSPVMLKVFSRATGASVVTLEPQRMMMKVMVKRPATDKKDPGPIIALAHLRDNYYGGFKASGADKLGCSFRGIVSKVLYAGNVDTPVQPEEKKEEVKAMAAPFHI